MLAAASQAAGSSGAVLLGKAAAGPVQLLGRRTGQPRQEQGLHSNSLKKKIKILSRDNTLTFRKRAGCWECPSSVGFLTVPHLNILHFTLSLLCPQSVKQ